MTNGNFSLGAVIYITRKRGPKGLALAERGVVVVACEDGRASATSPLNFVVIVACCGGKGIPAGRHQSKNRDDDKSNAGYGDCQRHLPVLIANLASLHLLLS
jgi:hypothetical protein